MSSSLTRLAGALADDVMKMQDASGQDRLFMEVAGVIAAASQTLEEAFLTEVRIRMAERKAREFLSMKAGQLGVPDPSAARHNGQ